MLAKTPRPSGTWAIPRRAIRWDGRPAIGTPLWTTLPEEGRTTPESARRMVLFPAPFAPIRQTISPFPTVKEIIAQRLHRSVIYAQMIDE